MTTTVNAARRPRAYRGQTPAERAHARRQRLIAAAIEVYGALGYRQATVKAVCAAAGLTDRYFYAAFENSEAALAACFETVTEDVLAIVGSAAEAESGDSLARGRAMLLAYFSVLRRERNRAQVFLIEMVGISDAIDGALESMLAKVGETIIETLDPHRRGPLAQDRLLVRGVASGLIGIAIAWIRGGYAEPIEAAADAALKLCALAITE